MDTLRAALEGELLEDASIVIDCVLSMLWLLNDDENDDTAWWRKIAWWLVWDGPHRGDAPPIQGGFPHTHSIIATLSEEYNL
jgi:hypothetical protein